MMIHNYRKRAAAALAWTLVGAGALAGTAVAQQEAQAELFTRPGGEGQVQAVVQITISEGWHLYHSDLGHPQATGKPLQVEFGGDGIEWGSVQLSKPGFYEEEPEVFVNVHHDEAFAYAVGILEPGVDVEDATVELSGLTCQTNGLCIPYDEELESEGEGPTAVWASFPADLKAPASSSVQETSQETSPSAGGFSPFGFPGGGADDEKVSAELFVREVDGEARAVVRIDVQPDWHIYHGPDEASLGDKKPIAQPTTLSLNGGDWQATIYPEPIAYPKGMSEIDYSEVPVNVHVGQVLFYARGQLEGSPGDVVALLEGQACDPETCLPFELELASRGAGPDEVFAAFPEASSGREATVSAGSADKEGEDGDSGGLGSLILKAILGGLITLLMPCTYPMIPITISFFTKQAIAREGNVLPLSLAYGAGIVIIFMLIGAVVGPVILAFATHPVTNLVIGGMFLFFAFVLFGAVNLQPPAFLMNAAGKASQKGGLFGVFLMGATLVVTSFTCTAPIMGTLLTSSAAGGSGLFEVVVGMGVFGATMAIPFVALSLLPGRMQKMPQAGEWMHVLKVFLGFVELAASLKFFSNSDVIWKWGVISRELFLVAWVGIFIAAALFLWGMIRLEGEDAERIGPYRLTGGLASFLFSLYCGMGVIGYQLDDIMTAIIPPYSTERLAGFSSGSGSAEEKGHVIVEDDLDLAKSRALSEDKLVLVNFTGHT